MESLISVCVFIYFGKVGKFVKIFCFLFLDTAKVTSIKSVGVWVFHKMKKAGSWSQRLMLFLCCHCFLHFFSHICQELTIAFLGGKYWRSSPPSLLLSSSVAYDTSAISCDIIQHKKDLEHFWSWVDKRVSVLETIWRSIMSIQLLMEAEKREKNQVCWYLFW